MDRIPAPLHDPRDVASWIHARLGGTSDRRLRLNMLVWLCDGWHLAIEGQRLCDARALALDVGPGYAEIVEDSHSRGIDALLGRTHGRQADLTPRQTEVCTRVLAKYGGLCSSDLGARCRDPQGAWMRTLLSRRGRDATIPTEAMLAEFTAFAAAGRTARAA